MDINKKDMLKTLDALTDALGRSDGQSVDEVIDELKEQGIDADTTLKRLKEAQQQISMAAKRSVLNIAREKRHKLDEKGHDFIGKFSDWAKDQIIGRIKELLGSEGVSEPSLAFRDLETMGSDELGSILEDLEELHKAKEDGDGE